MKRIFILSVCLLISSIGFSQITWTNGSGDFLWGTGNNWTGSVVPTTTDNVIFDGSQVANCIIDETVDVNDFSINAGYTGVITTGTNDINVNNNYAQASGSIDCGSNSILIIGLTTITGGTMNVNSAVGNFTGDFSLSNGLFNAGSVSSDFGANTTVSGGTFDGNTGGVTFNGNLLQSNGTFSVNACNLTANSDFTLSSGNFNGGTGVCDFNGIVNVSGGTFSASASALNISSNYSQTAGTFAGSTSTIFITGNLSISGGAFTSTSGSLTCEGSNISLTGGSFAHNSGIFINNRPSSALTSTFTGAFTFNRLFLTRSGSTTARTINFNTSVTTGTLTLNGSTTQFIYIGNINITRRLVVSGANVTNNAANTGSFTFSGALAKTFVGTGAVNRNQLATVIINHAVNLTMSGQINIRNAWINTNIGGSPLGTSTVNMLANTSITSGSTTTTRAYFDNLTIVGTCSIIGSSQINVKRSLTVNSTLNTNTSLIRLTGTGAATTQAITGTAGTTTLNALEIASNGAKTISTRNFVVLDSVDISAASGTLNVGAGLLRLRSTSTMKARIGRIPNNGAVTGSVAVETFLPGNITGWANLCSPGVTGQTMGSWNASIPMVCAGCPFTTVGGVPFESVYSYNEQVPGVLASDAAHYVTISGLAQSINPTSGYWVYLGNGQINTTDITPVLTGTINQKNSFGGITLTNIDAVNNSEKGWNLIANPYPAPISLTNMFAGQVGNIDNTIQVWDTDLNGGAGDWAFYTLGGATNAIPMGQGFMVRSLGTTINLTGAETWKTTSNSNVRKTPFDYTKLFKLNLTGGGAMNFDTYTYFDFSNSYNLGFDNGKDVYAIDNGSGNTVAQIYSKFNGDKYAIAAAPLPANHSNSIIPIHVPTGYSGNYTITPYNNDALVGLCVELIDLNNNSVHDLYFGAYSTTIAANNGSSPRFNLRVSDCGISDPVSIAEQNLNSSIYIGKDASGIVVKLDFEESTNTTISVTNVLGQKIIENKNLNALKETVSIDMLAKNQLIFVTVTTEKGRVTKKIIH